MELETMVRGSDQLSTTLPSYIIQNYERFIDFMQEGVAAQERQSFGQDILQNLLKYRNFSTYSQNLRQFDYLKNDIILDDSTQLTVTNADGFPLENGVLLVGDEIILYQYREDNVFYGLLRGASATVILPSFTIGGQYYSDTDTITHTVGTKVYNISILFLVSMLDTIHETFIPSISAERVHPDIGRSPLLRNIKDFYQSKGTKLGIKAFFKMLFGENDVQVRYPGDQMVKPSHSTWVQNRYLRVLPIPLTLTNPEDKYGTPSKLIGNEIVYRSYLDKEEKNVYAKSLVDYVSTYMFGDDIQYELSLVPDTIDGDFLANPNTTLTRTLDSSSTSADGRRDVTTVTVESTLGFPDKGLIFIGDEGIFYESKSFNQFFGCLRGYRGIEVDHEAGDRVFGPYFIESSYVENGETYVSRSWPLGLVGEVRVDDGGLLHTIQDEVVLNGPGRIDYREPILGSFDNIENYEAELARTVVTGPDEDDLPYIGNYTWGASGVAFDGEHVFVASSNLPQYPVGLFSNDNSIGPGLRGEFAIHVIPRRETIQPNDDIKHKGDGGIGVFVDGVPAYSNISRDRLVQGKIIDFPIYNQGEGYITPTVLINDEPGLAEAEVDTNLGHILSVTSTEDAPTSYQGEPAVIITSGRNAVIDLVFDRYGRVIGASVTEGGEYYFDTPALSVVDKTGKGKGAVLSCEVDGQGSIRSVSISHTGIDYTTNPDITSVVVTPVGASAVVGANIEYYEFNRWGLVEADSNIFFDDGNGFLYPDSTGNRTKFAYIADPVKLRELLGDDGSEHSPILGWAFDGNPIYGPYGYRDGKTNTSGVVRQKSAYVTCANRANMIPSNGTEPGTTPPNNTLPIGVFIQDYCYDPSTVELGSESTDGNDILNELNGKICNTPEFPEELYPDGVFCYFITINADETPAFPYIMGPTFNNKPITQKVKFIDSEEVNPIPYNISEPSSTYEDKVIDFDFEFVERYRNPYLESTKEGIRLEVSDVSQGHVSEIKVEDGAPYNRIVGDLLYFDDTDTKGQGAIGRITHIWGKDVETNEAIKNATESKLISHHQQIDLRHYTNWPAQMGASRKIGIITPGEEPSDLLYPETRLPVRTGDYFVYVSSGTAWNGDEVEPNDWAVAKGFASNVTWSNAKYQTDGELIFIEGDNIYTSSGAQSVIEKYENQILTVHTDTPNLVLPGDTFFDAKDTIVEILSTSTIEESSLFTVGVNTYLGDFFPEDESDLETGDLWWSNQTGRLYIYYGTDWVCTQPIGTKPMIGATNKGIGNTTSTTQSIYHSQTERTVTISTMAPSSRSDGSSLIEGDFWWSQHTGILYLYYEGVWVCTDPNGLTPMNPYDEGGRPFAFDGDPGSQTTGLKVIVSFKAPTTDAPYDSGTLWWSPGTIGTGIMYVKYDNTWAVANPVASFSTVYSLDTSAPDGGGQLPGGGGQGPGGGAGGVGPLPESEDQRILYFQNTTTFNVGDILEMQVGAPGVDPNEKVEVVQKLPQNGLRVNRGVEGTDKMKIPDGSKVENLDNYVYMVKTSEPHELVVNDEIFIEGSKYEEINGSLVIENVLGEDMFFIYTKQYLSNDSPIKYSTRKSNYQGEAAYAEVSSAGTGYEQIPPIIGSYPGLADRSIIEVTSDPLQNLAINDVNVVYGGNRYVNPVVIFYDEDRRGSGAEGVVTAENGKIIDITITNPGEGYVIPKAYVVEQDGQYIPISDTIGSIRAFRVIDPGRSLSADKSLKPEILITTRCIVSPTDDNVGEYTPGRTVYQGSADHKFVTATVVGYQADRQVVILNNVDGNLKDNEILYEEGTNVKFVVIKEGQADCSIIVDAESAKIGRWYDDTSKVSEELALIQDSYYYQWFSYVISSPLPQVKYQTFLEKIIHPSGFKLFSDLRIRSEVFCPVTPEDFINEKIQQIQLLGPDGANRTLDDVIGFDPDGIIVEVDGEKDDLNTIPQNFVIEEDEVIVDYSPPVNDEVQPSEPPESGSSSSSSGSSGGYY